MQATAAPPAANLDDPALYLNRELSWLQFNRRVLEEAQDPAVPLLERLKFLAIFSSNLDEFFMVRVADLKQRIWAGDQRVEADGLTPAETLATVSERVHALVQEQHRCFLEDLQPRLVAEGIRIVRAKEVTPEQAAVLEEYFHRTLLPVVTPLAIDPGHPFPHLVNRALCLVVSLRFTEPSVLPPSAITMLALSGSSDSARSTARCAAAASLAAACACDRRK